MAEGPPVASSEGRSALNLPPILRFAITGVANSVVGFSVLVLALRLGLSDIAANLTGFAAGLTVGFIANRKWTFGVEGRVNAGEIARYLAGFALAWSLNFGVVMIGIRAGHAGSPLIHLAGIVTYSVAFYFISRSFVFATSPETTTPQSLLGEMIVVPFAALLFVAIWVSALTGIVRARRAFGPPRRRSEASPSAARWSSPGWCAGSDMSAPWSPLPR